MEILTRKELADRLKVSTQTIVKWEETGMPAIKNNQIVRYDWASVLNWMKQFESFKGE